MAMVICKMIMVKMAMLTGSVTRLLSMPILPMMVLLAGMGFMPRMVMVSTDQGLSGRMLVEQFFIVQQTSLRQHLSAKDVIVVVAFDATVG